MNEIQKLDAVLKFLLSKYPNDQQLRPGVIAKQIIEITPELNDDTGFIAEIYAILDKLEADRYVRQDYIPGRDWHVYSLTFDGLYFIKYADGYQGLQNQRNHQAYLDKQRERKVDALASFQRKQAVRLNRLTAWAVGGTIALLLWEILKYFVFDHHWYFHPY